MNEMCMIVRCEELSVRLCFMEKWWCYEYKRGSVEWNS